MILLLVHAVVARAQTRVVVIAWTVAGDSEPLAAVSRADAIRASLRSPFTAMATDEAREHFAQLGSTEPRPISDQDIDHLLALSREAVRQLAHQDYVAARASLEEAQILSEGAIEEINRDQQRARHVLDTCLFGVRAFVETEDPGAEAAALECRRLVPATTPSPHIHTPEVVDVLARVDSRLTAEHAGTLTIDSDPSDCTIRANGVVLGRSPLTSPQLPAGEYRIQAECEGLGAGRVHTIVLGAHSASVQIDARFDAAVRTQEGLRLEYPSAAAADSSRAHDALELARTVGADEAWLVGARMVERFRAGSSSPISATDDPETSGVLAALTASVSVVDPLREPGGQSAIPSGSVDPAPWVVVGVGSAALIAGAIVLGLGVPDYNAVGAPRPSELMDRRDRGRTQRSCW